jgi:Flp pilus assembly protein TadG
MNNLGHQRGVAAIEFALLLIPLTILAFGITEYGRAMYQYNTIAKATRDAARYMSMQAPGDAGAMAKAKCLVVFGKAACSGNPLVPGLTAQAVTIVIKDSSTNPGTHALQPVSAGGGPVTGVANLVTVEVSGFRFVSLVSFVAPDMTFGTIGTTMFGAPPS